MLEPPEGFGSTRSGPRAGGRGWVRGCLPRGKQNSGGDGGLARIGRCGKHERKGKCKFRVVRWTYKYSYHSTFAPKLFLTFLRGGFCSLKAYSMPLEYQYLPCFYISVWSSCTNCAPWDCSPGCNARSCFLEVSFFCRARSAGSLTEF